MTYLGNAGGTGQVLTVSGGAPVWQASSPTLLWEADLTTGQTAGSWAVPSAGNVIVGSSGTGNLNWSTTNFQGTAWSVAMVNGSGLELTAPAAPAALSQTGVSALLDQLGLSYFSGRPFRIWTQSTRSGTINTVSKNQIEAWQSTFGNTNSASCFRGFGTAGGVFLSSFGFGTDRQAGVVGGPNPASSVYYDSDVFCMTSSPGNITMAFGSYSGGWPSTGSLYTFNSGAIQTGQLTPLGTSPAPYTATPSFFIIPYVDGGGTYTNRKWIIQRIRIEGL